MKPHLRLIAAALTVAPITLMTAAPSFAGATQPGASAHTDVIAACTKVEYQPVKYIFTCGDAGQGMTHTTYSSYGKDGAYGSGTYVYQTCNPSCAAGKIKKLPGTKIHLFDVTKTKKYGRLFTKAKLTYPSGKSQTYRLPTKPE